MFCAQCGQLVAVGMNFCPHCGAPIAAMVPPAAAPSAEARARGPSPLPDLDSGDVGATAVGLVARVKAVLLAPSATWPVIAAEPSSAAAIYGRYVAPLAAIGVIAACIGQTVIGYNVPLLGHMRTGIFAGLGAAVLGYLLSFVSVLVIAWLVDALAPTFGGQLYPGVGGWQPPARSRAERPRFAGRMLRLVSALSRLAGADALSEGKIA